jgi:hypothetical protein
MQKHNGEIAEAIFHHDVLAVSINRTIDEDKTVYEAAQCAWLLNPKNAEKVELVLAVKNGIIIGVFRPECWIEATEENFPHSSEIKVGEKRYGFRGIEAPHEITSLYLGRIHPAWATPKGRRNPVKYSFKNKD